MRDARTLAILMMLGAALLSACDGGSGDSGKGGDSDSPNAAADTTELTFVPDSGIRVEYAGEAGPGVDPATGYVWLYYNDKSVTGGDPNRRAVSTDGLNFPAGQTFSDYANSPRRVRLPDGSWRLYQFDPQSTELNSLISQDGVNFTQESGSRYTLQPEDYGTMGVYEIFADPLGGVVMLYLGDLYGKNNLRRAYSTDNGDNFVFDHGNVLGDDNAGGGPNTYVDPKTILLPDGRRWLFTMTQDGQYQGSGPGTAAIHSWISDADMTAFTRESGARLRCSDFTEFTVFGLFDPFVVRLQDGRYRMYVTAEIDDGSGSRKQVIVSATTP